jgi:hypothetical protein
MWAVFIVLFALGSTARAGKGSITGRTIIGGDDRPVQRPTIRLVIARMPTDAPIGKLTTTSTFVSQVAAAAEWTTYTRLRRGNKPGLGQLSHGLVLPGAQKKSIAPLKLALRHIGNRKYQPSDAYLIAGPQPSGAVTHPSNVDAAELDRLGFPIWARFNERRDTTFLQFRMSLESAPEIFLTANIYRTGEPVFTYTDGHQKRVIQPRELQMLRDVTFRIYLWAAVE